MPYRKYPFVVVATVLLGCSPANSHSASAADMQTATSTLPVGPTSEPPSDIMWTKTESPLFPASWPPTPETVWVSYTFAYGMNPALLMDGSYVAYPLARTEWKAGKHSTTTLRNDMAQAAIQGVTPLDSEAQAILNKGKQVSGYCLTLAALPQTSTPEAKDMLAYYHAWFSHNGAFLGLIRDDHAEFIGWITRNP